MVRGQPLWCWCTLCEIDEFDQSVSSSDYELRRAVDQRYELQLGSDKPAQVSHATADQFCCQNMKRTRMQIISTEDVYMVGNDGPIENL